MVRRPAVTLKRSLKRIGRYSAIFEIMEKCRESPGSQTPGILLTAESYGCTPVRRCSNPRNSQMDDQR